MKRPTLILLLLLVSLRVAAIESSVVNSILHSFRTGEVDSLAVYMDETSLLNSSYFDQIAGVEEVKGELSKMYAGEKPQRFELLHKGEKEHSAYVVVNLSIHSASYRVSIYIQRSDTKTIIKLIRIEKNENRTNRPID